MGSFLPKIVGRMTRETFKETAERRGLSKTQIVTDLLDGQVRTGKEKIFCLRCQILLNIIAGGDTD